MSKEIKKELKNCIFHFLEELEGFKLKLEDVAFEISEKIRDKTNRKKEDDYKTEILYLNKIKQIVMEDIYTQEDLDIKCSYLLKEIDENIKVDDVLKKFTEISIECGN